MPITPPQRTAEGTVETLETPHHLPPPAKHELSRRFCRNITEGYFVSGEHDQLSAVQS